LSGAPCTILDLATERGMSCRQILRGGNDPQIAGDPFTQRRGRLVDRLKGRVRSARGAAIG
jgi:hypothetical protein